MIASDFIYIRADTAEEAVEAWSRHENARYLAGGTEITTSARKAGALPIGACIDVKRIPEANVFETVDGHLRIGAALALSDVADRAAFPLLDATLRGIADRTVRNRLTLGGNLAGMLPYREAALPLLLADATLTTLLPGQNGARPERRARKLRESFDKRLLLATGELILSISIPIAAIELPWSHRRKTRSSSVDYPLVTLCMVRDGKSIRLAVAGAHPYPVRSDAADAALSQNGQAGIEAVLAAFGLLRADQRATAAYRAALLANLIRAAMEELE